MLQDRSVLDKLFSSRTRVKLLSVFLLHPGRPFYVRELERRTEEQINSVRRELLNLVDVGLLQTEQQRGKLYYTVRPGFPILAELTAIFEKIRPLEDLYALEAKKINGLQLAVLTGHFTGEENTKVDALFVGNITSEQLAPLLAKLEKDLNAEMRYTFLTPSEYQYRLSYNDLFLTQVLEGRKRVLIDRQRYLKDS